MRKQLVMLFVGAAIAVGCGEVKKTEPKRSYLITPASATSVSRLAMTTAALVGRHAVIPKGADTNPDNVRLCPISKEENKIVITPACTPAFDGTVECVFTEVYTCPEVSGTIVNTVNMGPESLDFKLEMDGYQEGNADLGFIKYTGEVSATTKADGSTSYSSTIAVVARGLGATEDTIADSSGEVTVTTSETSIEFNGFSNLNTPLGKATMAFNKVDFGDCAVSPKSGTIDLALVGLERAVLRFDACGDVKLVHFVGDAAGEEETLTAEQVASAFGSSVSDVTNMKGVPQNVEPSAPALTGAEGEMVFGNAGAQWCVPYISGTNLLMASDVTLNVAQGGNFDSTSIASETNPINECLIFNPATTPTKPGTFVHLVIVDETGLGAFGDPTKNKIVFAQAGLAIDGATPYGAGAAVPAGKVSMTWFIRYANDNLSSALPVYQSAFDPTRFSKDANEDTNPDFAYCAPGASCGNSKLLSYVFDHFGLGLVQSAAKAYWFAHTYVGE